MPNEGFPCKSIILNANFLVFNTNFLVFSRKFIIFTHEANLPVLIAAGGLGALESHGQQPVRSMPGSSSWWGCLRSYSVVVSAVVRAEAHRAGHLEDRAGVACLGLRDDVVDRRHAATTGNLSGTSLDTKSDGVGVYQSALSLSFSGFFS